MKPHVHPCDTPLQELFEISFKTSYDISTGHHIGTPMKSLMRSLTIPSSESRHDDPQARKHTPFPPCKHGRDRSSVPSSVGFSCWGRPPTKSPPTSRSS